MRLFDDFERTDLLPARNTDGIYKYLNFSARPEIEKIRILIQNWFDHYPECKEKYTLLGRFIANDRNPHHSAFFELFIHELFLNMGFQIDLHPDIEGMDTHPDFKTHKDGFSQFFIEATINTSSIKDLGQQRLLDEFFDKLNKINSPSYRFWITYSGLPSSSFSIREIEKEININLCNWDVDELYKKYESAGFDAMPYLRIKKDSFQAKLIFAPKHISQRNDTTVRNIIATMGDAYCVKTDDDLNKSICNKANKYKIIDMPLIIAVNCIDNKIINLKDEDVVDAFFGKSQFHLHLRNGEVVGTSSSRDNVGALFYKENPINTRVSGVLVCSNFTSSSFTNRYIKLWHNPYATNCVDYKSILLDQMIPNQETGEFNDITGAPLKELLCLSELYT